MRDLAAAAAVVAAAALCTPALARAQAPGADAAFRSEYLAELAITEKKVRRLAEAIPQERWGWRPAEGVRSIAEVFAHVAGGNYFLVKLAGTPIPADVPEDLERITSKAEILAWLDRSFAHVRAAFEATDAGNLARDVDFFGQKTTVRGLYLKAYGHLSEHMGQAIAYARSVGVTPPWNKPAS